MKFIRSLSVKKYREHEGLFIAEGEKIVTELLNSSLKIHSLYFIKEWQGKIKRQDNQINYFEISESELKKISLLEKPNKVLAITHIPGKKIEFKNFAGEFTLMMDDIRDPGNLGNIIRIADWFGIKNIICSNETADVYNPKVVQSSMGSLFRLNIFYEDLQKALKEFQKEKIHVYGTVLNGENVLNKKLNPKSILLMGNESKGISSELLSFIDEKITIPKADGSVAESLNVASATSILCYEFFKSSAK